MLPASCWKSCLPEKMARKHQPLMQVAQRGSPWWGRLFLPPHCTFGIVDSTRCSLDVRWLQFSRYCLLPTLVEKFSQTLWFTDSFRCFFVGKRFFHKRGWPSISWGSRPYLSQSSCPGIFCGWMERTASQHVFSCWGNTTKKSRCNTLAKTQPARS